RGRAGETGGAAQTACLSQAQLLSVNSNSPLAALSAPPELPAVATVILPAARTDREHRAIAADRGRPVRLTRRGRCPTGQAEDQQRRQSEQAAANQKTTHQCLHRVS